MAFSGSMDSAFYDEWARSLDGRALTLEGSRIPWPEFLFKDQTVRLDIGEDVGLWRVVESKVGHLRLVREE